MKDNLTRRDFLKKTSVSAAGVTALSLTPSWASTLGKKGTKSRVVIAKDASCSGNQAKIQDMVDYAIMNLTGVSDKVKAYEALFPAGKLTTSTKIMIKYNEVLTNTSNKALIALKTGLTSMLGGTYPATGITMVGKDTSAQGTVTFSLGAGEQRTNYTLRKAIEETDYYINFAPCYTMSSCGTRMALKNTITCYTGGSISSMHTYFTNATYPAYATLNSQVPFKSKNILVLIDAIDKASPNGSAALAAYTIIATKDIVAAEYQGIELLKAIATSGNQVSTTIQNTVKTVLGQTADPKYGLGTNDPAQMEVINIGPPWTTAIVTPGQTETNIKDIHVKTHASNTIFTNPGASASVSIYTAQGRIVWTHRSSARSLTWENTYTNGRKVPAGMYLYQMKVEDVVVRGEIVVQ